MADRRLFSEKYNNLVTRWNISSEILSYIIRRYEKLLILEQKSLKENVIKLPRFFRDKRTDEEYLYDLIDGWLMEDIICDAWLKPKLLEIKSDIEIKNMGTNRDRVIQKSDSSKISTKPDFVFEVNGQDVGIELQMARAELAKGYDMKETKVKRAIKDGNLFLWVIVPKDEYFIIDPQSEMSLLKPEANPLWGGKIVYHISQQFIEKVGGYSKMIDKIPNNFIKKLKLL